MGFDTPFPCKNMKQIFTSLLLCLILAGCGPKGNSFVLKGKFQDLKDGELFIYDRTSGAENFDTIRVRDGEFLYEGEARRLTEYTLVFPNAVEQVIFINAGNSLVYEASAKDLRNYKVSGNEENELMNRFRQDTDKKNEAQVRDVAMQYIMDNPVSPIAIHLFDRYFVQDENVDSEEVKSLLAQLKLDNPQNLYLLTTEGKLGNVGKGKVDSVLPALTLPTREGDSISIANIKSDYTLIVYWATWCEDSYSIMDRIREVRKVYKNEDSLCIISVSLDTEIRRWQDYTKTDLADINNYCEGEAWDAPVVQELNITNLPAYVIADKSHKIIIRKEDNNLKDMLSDIRRQFFIH